MSQAEIQMTDEQKPDLCKSCPLYERPMMRPRYLVHDKVAVISSYPMVSETSKGPFTSRNSEVIKRILNANKGNPPVSYWYDYACQCAPEYLEDAKKFNININIYNKCSVFLKHHLDIVKPKAIIAMGMDAVKSLGIKEQFKDTRGGIFYYETEEGRIPIIATYHPVAVVKDSGGLVPTFIKDLSKAVDIANGQDFKVDLDIRTPTHPDDIIDYLNEIILAAEYNFTDTGKSLCVAVDTETTSLYPYNKDDRVIMISMSHKEAEGLAYPFEHKDCKFTEDEFNLVKAKTEEVLSHPHVAIVMANGKFDMQWLQLHYGMKVNPLVYDVILAEHILDEDKKGNYSLKALTRDRFPFLGRYESELKAHLEKVWGDKDAKIAQIKDEYKESIKDSIIEWWLSLNIDERTKILTEWIAKGYFTITDINPLVNVKYRKLKGELVIAKCYKESLTKLVKQVPDEELSKYCTFVDLKIPDELLCKSYEDADLETLLKYAAIDALTTRMVLKAQNKDFLTDVNRIRSVENYLKEKLPTRQCYEVFFDNTMPLCQCIAEMEYNGVRIDRDECRRFIGILEEKIAEAEHVVLQEVGKSFNLSASSPELSNVLFNELNLPVRKLTETGAPSTDADTLKELYDEFKLPLLEKLLAYRKLDKSLNTYVKKWLEISEYDGRIHTSFNQIGTATYRLSSSNPEINKLGL